VSFDHVAEYSRVRPVGCAPWLLVGVLVVVTTGRNDAALRDLLPVPGLDRGGEQTVPDGTKDHNDLMSRMLPKPASVRASARCLSTRRMPLYAVAAPF